MTKQEAIEILEDMKCSDGDYWCELYNEKPCAEPCKEFEALEMAIEVLQDKIDEEDSPCNDCYNKHCDNCLYSGRIPG